jgi:hypothetical protein
MKKIILISGKACHGKTTAANIIKMQIEKMGYRAIIVNFASYLKFICEKYYGWDGKKGEAGRQILQKVGTDIARSIEPDFWVNATWDFIRVFCTDTDYVIIDDVRFINEVEFFKKRGISSVSIRVHRENFKSSLTPEQLIHKSEIDLDEYPFDVWIGSESGIDNLAREVDKVFENIIS